MSVHSIELNYITDSLLVRNAAKAVIETEGIEFPVSAISGLHPPYKLSTTPAQDSYDQTVVAELSARSFSISFPISYEQVNSKR